MLSGLLLVGCGDGTDRGAAAQGGSDWAWVGNVPEEPWSVFMWYRLFMSFFDGPRKPTDSFFLFAHSSICNCRGGHIHPRPLY